MALEEGFSEGGTSTSPDSNDQLLLAIPRRGFECPICLDTIEDETSVMWCRHAFCFPCIMAWACLSPVCPICQEPFKYLFRKVGDMNYDVYFTRRNRRRRAAESRRRHSTGHRHPSMGHRHHSTGHRHRRSSRQEHVSGQARDLERNGSRNQERDRGRSRRRNRDGHRRGQESRGYHPSSSRRWQHSRRSQRSRRWRHSQAYHRVSETSSGWDQTSRHEWDVPVRLRRSEQRQQAQGVSFRESRATRSRSRRRPHSTWRQTQREEQRRMDHNERQSARSEEDVRSSSGRSEHRQ